MRVTRRGWAVAVIALLFYFFANQTQVGWLYVLSALAAGLWLATLALPGRMLRGLAASRRVLAPLAAGSSSGAELELHAGQPVHLELTFQNNSRLPVLLLRGLEPCALAPLPDRNQILYIAAIAGRAAARVTIANACARRGWFPFAPLQVETRAPFGLSRARRTLAAAGPEGVLVFPEYRELEQLALFDQRPAAETNAARLGAAGEFIGVRDFRPGDPRRSVHWRSTARAGRLIVKEFAAEAQPALTMALDLRAGAALGPQGDTLELGIKVAATLARYALRRSLPFSLVTNSRTWPAPPGPLSWWGLMSYLARVAAEGEAPFGECLRRLPPGTFVAAILPAPDSNVLAPLTDLRRAGLSLMAILIDPSPFVPGSAGHGYGVEARRLAAELESTGIAARLVGAEPDWERVLAE
jgi:uncharacterized protein (DUF58 family)